MVGEVRVLDIKKLEGLGVQKPGESESASVTPLRRQIKDWLQGGDMGTAVDAIGTSAQEIDQLDDTELKLSDKTKDDEFAWLQGSQKDAVVSPKALGLFSAVISSLREDLLYARTPSAALVYKKEAAPMMDKLVSVLSLSSDTTEDTLATLKDEVRGLLYQAVDAGRASPSVDREALDYVLGMLDPSPSKSVKATADLLKKVGIKKLSIPTSGFLGALSGSYGQLGNVLAGYVQQRVQELTTRPAALITDDAEELDPGTVEAIQDWKEATFDEVFDGKRGVRETWEKKSQHIVDKDDTEGGELFDRFALRSRELYLAKDLETAEQAAKDLVLVMASVSNRADRDKLDYADAKRISDVLRRAKNKKDVQVVPVSLRLLKDSDGKLTISEDLQRKLGDLLVAQAQEEVKREAEPFVWNMDKAKVALADIKRSITDESPSTEIELSDGTKIKGITKEHINHIERFLTDNGEVNTAQTNFPDDIAPFPFAGDDTDSALSAVGLLSKIRDDKKTIYEEAQRSRRDSAEVVVADSQAGKLSTEILASQPTIYMPLGKDSGFNALADELRAVFDDKKVAAKRDEKYHSRFAREFAFNVLSPVLSKSSTISKTNMAALMASMIDREGNINQDFFEAIFKDQTDTVNSELQGLEQELDADLEALKQTAQAQSSVVDSAVEAMGISGGYKALATKLTSALGLESNADINSKNKFTALLKAAGIRLSEKEVEIISPDAVNDKSGYDLLVLQARRVGIIAKKLEDLSKVYKKGLGRLGETEQSKLRGFIESFGEADLGKVSDASSTVVQSSIRRLESSYFEKIEAKEKERDAISEIANTDVWEIIDTPETKLTDAARKIIDSFKMDLQTTMRQIFGSLGLFTKENVDVFKEKVASIDEDSASSSGMLRLVNATLTALSNKNGGAGSDVSETKAA